MRSKQEDIKLSLSINVNRGGLEKTPEDQKQTRYFSWAEIIITRFAGKITHIAISNSEATAKIAAVTPSKKQQFAHLVGKNETAYI